MWSWNSRLGLQMKHAARHQRGIAVGAVDHAVDRIRDRFGWGCCRTRIGRWAPRLSSATSFENSAKRSCDSHIVRPKVRALNRGGSEHVLQAALLPFFFFR